MWVSISGFYSMPCVKVSCSCLGFGFRCWFLHFLLWPGLVIFFVVGVKIVIIRLRYPGAWLGWVARDGFHGMGCDGT